VGLSCESNKVTETLEKLSVIAGKHVDWLESIGMVPNVGKTEFIVFGSAVPFSLLINNSSINSTNTLKILGVNFTSNLSWSDHVSKTIKKCNRLGYTLRFLDSMLSRPHHKRIIESHFCSTLYYGSPIWAGCISSKDLSRLNTLMFKIIRMHCRDFSRIFSNRELCQTSQIRSFNSVRILRDTNTLHSLCTNPTNTLLTLRLIQQSYCHSRFRNRISFFDNSQRKIGRNSFVNRSKRIAELIPFEWADLNRYAFKRRIAQTVPLYIA